MNKRKPFAGGLVYSTHPEALPPTPQLEGFTPLPANQDLRVTIDKKLKGGKTATVVYNFVGQSADLEELGRRLKQLCGVGGTAKNGEIILQGNHLQKVTEELKRLGYRFKVAGV